ncbi:hypothetical protein GCM10010988_06680 [Cnuibacter physcomitrellae]|uniref:Uncharacterized protein n=1 Tax=Cnuibacter physcomitrellae TaxID=1619308 RepID=A0A1X9LNN9_9MICO|nr:hypothetical protein [Cnuibacter physcomitrellae]ARJ05571.1 hypothetical protein B5808_10285 [Cnuibacter physcomitrellae]GGI35984.1 hypothetical protein GCM10010988_06680 [Cnuibacter physcomitrellae]
MVVWFSIAQVLIAVAAGILCVVLGLLRRVPSDLTMGALALVELLLIVQLVVTFIAPAVGNPPSGDPLEFYVYLVSAILLPIAGGFWALVERSRWSTVVIGAVCLAIAVMVWRMNQIWLVQGV